MRKHHKHGFLFQGYHLCDIWVTWVGLTICYVEEVMLVVVECHIKGKSKNSTATLTLDCDMSCVILARQQKFHLNKLL